MSTQLTIPEWTGGHRLNNGEFLSYAEAVVKAYAAVGFDRLALATVGPQLAAAVNTLATALQREAAFDETNTIAQADATRDTLFRAFWNCWNELMNLDPHHALYTAANTLRSELSDRKGLYKHSLAKETAEIDAMQAELEKSGPVGALKELGLYKILGHLFEANAAVKTAMNARNAERGSRAEERAAGSVPELRKATAELILAAARMVNALNMVTPTDDTASAIKSVYGIVEQYKLVAAHHSKKSDGSDDTPAPSPDPSPATPAS